MRGWLVAMGLMSSGCLRPAEVAPLPRGAAHQSVVLFIGRGPELNVEARDFVELDGFAHFTIPSDAIEAYALFYPTKLAELGMASGAVRIASQESAACTDLGATIELTDPLPFTTDGFHLEEGQWKPGVPAEISSLRLLKTAANPCLGFEPLPAALVMTTTTSVRGVLISFVASLSRTEAIVGWPNGELTKIERDQVELIPTGLPGIVGGVARPARGAWLVDGLGAVRCWSFTNGECPAPTPPLPERPIRFATLSPPESGGPEGTLAAIDTGGLYRLDDNSAWVEIFRASKACDPTIVDCNNLNPCFACRVQIARFGDRAAAVFRSSAELVLIEGGAVDAIDPPSLPGRPDDHPNVLAFDPSGRLIVGQEAGVVQRREPDGHWSTLAQVSSTIEALLVSDDAVFASGSRAQIVQSYESDGLGKRWCGAQTLRGVQQSLGLLPLGAELLLIGDGSPDLNYLVPIERPGPGCPEDVR